MTTVVLVVGFLFNVAAIFFLIDGLLTRRKVLELVAVRDSEESSVVNMEDDKHQTMPGLQTRVKGGWYERPKLAARSNIGFFEREQRKAWENVVAQLAEHQRRISDRNVQQHLFPDIVQPPLEQIEEAIQSESSSAYYRWPKPATQRNPNLYLVSNDYVGEVDKRFWMTGADPVMIEPKTSGRVLFSRPVKRHKGQTWDDDESLFGDVSHGELRSTVGQ